METGRVGRTRSLLLGLAALAAAGASAAATVSSPYRSASSPAKAARLASPGQEGLDFDPRGLARLRSATGTVRLESFPVAPGTQAALVLERFEVLAPGARVTATGPDGESSFPFPAIAHFRGTVDGEPDSSAYVSAHEGRLYAWIRSSAGNAYVGPDESGTEHVVRASDSPLNERELAESFSCGVEELPAALTGNAEPAFSMPMAPLAGLKQGAIRVDTDYELYDKFDDVTELGGWVATLYGAVNVAYERDLSLHLALAEVHTWTTGAGSDPYVSTSTRTQLDEVGDWWHANRPMASYPRASVQFLSGKSVSGGIAWLSVLCTGDFGSGNGHYGGAYAVTQVYGSYPLASWDQFATAHETGHNAGSHHTHCYSPPIDHCYASETGCYSGPTENPGAGNGTIMSYCHFFGWSAVSYEFHPRCISEQLMPHINSRQCLTEASTFLDVPPSHPFYDFVETLAAHGVTGGCGGGNYCPDGSVTRAQMAVFLLKAKYGSGHTPPAATGSVFGDVPANAFAAAWIEELAALGVTTGCGVGNYCPDATVSREQMAVFLLKAKLGSGHAPPSPAGVFNDVPVSSGYAAWIEELYASDVTGGCQTQPLMYCPKGPNTRGQMAVFLVKAFDLQ